MHRYFEVNEGGHNIRCKLYYEDLRAIRRVVIFCHGFGGHKDNGAAERFAQWVLSKYGSTGIVTFNWPCHGDDVKKKLTLSDCDSYLSLVVGYARERFAAEELYCYATSFGGYQLLRYIHQYGSPFRRIALRCPAVDMYEAFTCRIVTPEQLQKLQKGKDVQVGFDRKVPVTLNFLQELEQQNLRKMDFLDWAEDILIIHGTSDEIIPFASAQSFADEQLMEFAPVEGADHRFRDPKGMDRAIKLILEHFAF